MLKEGNTQFSLGGQTQIVTEAFWAGMSMVQQAKFTPKVVMTLFRLGVNLPSLDVTHVSEEGQEELRVVSHGGIEDCGCFHCLVRPHLENKKEELWESEWSCTSFSLRQLTQVLPFSRNESGLRVFNHSNHRNGFVDCC